MDKTILKDLAVLIRELAEVAKAQEIKINTLEIRTDALTKTLAAYVIITENNSKEIN